MIAKAFYRVITAGAKSFGPWFFRLFSRFVATGYYIFFPSRVAAGIRFYRALFPGRSRIHYLFCVLRQFYSFTEVFLDRFLLESHGELSYTSEGWDRLEEAKDSGRGGIIVMSHLGNWDVAAHLFRRRGMDLLIYLGAKQKEQLERMQKTSLSEAGLTVIVADKGGGSPFDILEAIGILRKGGFVSLTGDRLWTAGQRRIQVDFAGHKADIPEAPHALALASGAPLFYLFAIRTGPSRYHIAAQGPFFVGPVSRDRRAEALRNSAQHYADILAETARAYPDQWYHFEEFLTRKEITPSG